MIIKFTLNHKSVSIDTDPGRKLAEVLRNEFNLLSVKENCVTGRCGACTVLKNNLPVPACAISMFTVKNCVISTFEEIAETKKYNIMKEAFAAAGCSFCDFCFHGKMLTIYSLLDSYDELTDPVIYKALSGNVCSCSDFDSIVKGIKIASIAIRRIKHARK